MSYKLCEIEKRSRAHGTKSILWLMVAFCVLHLVQALFFNFALFYQFNYVAKFGPTQIKIDKYFVAIFFLIIDVPFLVLALFYNDPRNCQMYFTKFNLMDIMVTIMSAFYIIIEDTEQVKRQKNLGGSILKKLEKKENRRLEEMIKEYETNKEGFENNKEKILQAKQQGAKLSKRLQSFDDFARMSIDGIIHMYREREINEDQNEQESDDEIELELSEDIYCITFIKFLKDEPLVQRELMMKSVIAFIM